MDPVAFSNALYRDCVAGDDVYGRLPWLYGVAARLALGRAPEAALLEVVEGQRACRGTRTCFVHRPAAEIKYIGGNLLSERYILIKF